MTSTSRVNKTHSPVSVILITLTGEDKENREGRPSRFSFAYKILFVTEYQRSDRRRSGKANIQRL